MATFGFYLMGIVFDFVVIALAVARISKMLADENGPWYILESMRYRAGVRYDKYSTDRVSTTWVAEGVMCVWCNSVWVGILFAVLYAVSQRLTLFVALPFALSMVSIFLWSWHSQIEAISEHIIVYSDDDEEV